ncbi:ECF transporter S component [Brevibacillus humidisoli]|uniref:ECF transporter S component n=1 Tax=Brevibacillus humidisoli TaxID=2895522 RepID=UPI001E2D1706|nr:ECF transporter S component [Brevibacillus humidisoli]UFJ41291.1 ECF transporter S component [Brevibacillus humidisoli]
MHKTEVRTMQEVQTRKLVLLAFLGAIAFALYYLEFSIPLVPTFLKLDVSTLPGLVGGLMFGPVAGMVVELLKNILHFFFKNSDGLLIGEIANFLAGASFIVATVAIQRRYKTVKAFVAGLVLGTLLMTLLMALGNYYLLLPAYAMMYQISVEDLLAMFQMDSLWSYIVYAIVPFNLIKGLVLSLIAYPIYLKLIPRLPAS